MTLKETQEIARRSGMFIHKDAYGEYEVRFKSEHRRIRIVGSRAILRQYASTISKALAMA